MLLPGCRAEVSSSAGRRVTGPDTTMSGMHTFRVKDEFRKSPGGSR